MDTLKETIKNGEIAVIRTDTLYGIIADAHNEEAVARVYEIKHRNPSKPVIVLVADYEDIETFGVDITEELKERLNHYWPGKVSIILPVTNEVSKTSFLHRGTNTIAFRIPDDQVLRDLLKETGPVIAPSANREGESPAMIIEEAQAYFGNDVTYYHDGGAVTDTKPSQLIELHQDGTVTILR